MTISPAVLQPGVALPTTAGGVVTSPANTVAIIKRAVCANITGAAVTIALYRVPSGGAALLIVPNRAISANGTDLLPELTNMVLNAGDSIEAQASAAASINFFASGFTQ